MKYCPACNFSFPDFHQVCDFDGTELVPDPEQESLVSAPPSRLRRVLRSPVFLTSLAFPLLIFSAVLIGYLESGEESIPTVKYQTLALPINHSAEGTIAFEQSPAQVNSPAPSQGSSIASLKKLPGSARAMPRRQGSPFRSVVRLNKKTSHRDLFESKSRAEPTSDVDIPREVGDEGGSDSELRAAPSPQAGSPRAAVVATGSDTFEIATRKENQQTSRTAATQTARRDVSNEKSGKITAFLKTTWKVLKKPFDFNR